MNRSDYESSIRESVEELYKLERSQSKSIHRDRVRFIRLLKSGSCTSQKEAGASVGLRIAQSQVIWRRYREGGIASLLGKPSRHGWGKLDSRQISCLRTRLSGHDMYTQDQIAGWLRDEFGIAYTQGGISLLLKRLKIKLKTGRPVNVRKDAAEGEEFKKNLRP